MVNLKTAQLGTNVGNNSAQQRGGFTLIQILAVIGILAVLSAILMGTFSRARVPANRAKCDVNLKQVALALDTFRQERGQLPKGLKELRDNQYVSVATLRCPSDPDISEDPKSKHFTSYDKYYVLREPRDSGELPVIVCPFHEKDGEFGAQAYKGGYTKQFAARPASLKVGDFNGTVTITRPGQGVLALPTSAAEPLQLRGGDSIKVGAGEATIRFQDGSTATIGNGTEMSVMQSFIEGQSGGTLYTLVKQVSGTGTYYVNPGSRFDVSTPTATAGALGTRFTVLVTPDTSTVEPDDTDTYLTVTEHTVAFSALDSTVNITPPDGRVNHKSAKAKKVRTPRVKGKGKGNGRDDDD